MVFMTSPTDLELYADLDLLEMQKVGSVDGKLQVVVQINRRRFPTPARFHIEAGRRRLCEPLPRRENAGDPEVLSDFLQWAAETYPAEKYLLVLWGHAFGVGFGRDNGNALTISELARVLDGFAKRTKKTLDMLGCDTCSMSKAEAVYQFRDAVKFLVASQITVPFAGWPYETVFSRIVEEPAIEPEALGAAIAAEYVDSYKPPRVVLSVVNVQEGAALKDAIASLANSLVAAVKDEGPREFVRGALKATAHGDERALIDLGNFCQKLLHANLDAAIRDSARLTLDVLHRIVRRNEKSKPPPRGLNGLGIYAPPVTSAEDWESLGIWRTTYRALDLSKDTQWDELVYGLLDAAQRAPARRSDGGSILKREEEHMPKKRKKETGRGKRKKETGRSDRGKKR
jgi:hypothetical protein